MTTLPWWCVIQTYATTSCACLFFTSWFLMITEEGFLVCVVCNNLLCYGIPDRRGTRSHNDVGKRFCKKCDVSVFDQRWRTSSGEGGRQIWPSRLLHLVLRTLSRPHPLPDLLLTILECFCFARMCPSMLAWWMLEIHIYLFAFFTSGTTHQCRVAPRRLPK